MKEKILDIIKTFPRHYVLKIKNDKELMDWIIKNKQTNSNNIAKQIYSAVYNISDICEHNNIKKFDRWTTGFVGCGPASKCLCTKEKISNSVTKTKSIINQNEINKSNEKRKNTMLDKYGVEYNSQRKEIKPILSKPKINITKHNILTNYEWLYNEYEIKKRTTVDIASQLNIHYSTVIDYLKKQNFNIRKTSNYSLQETEIKNYIKKELNIPIIENDRNILDGKELDIFIPEYNIAIEINGLYWHSYGIGEKEDINYHLNKKQKCLEQDINLLYITDYEWINKQDIVKSIIKSKLKLNDKIYARKCNIKEIETNVAKKFFNENHLDGFIGSSNYIGLIYNDELVMCMSFGKNRFGDGMELHRMASKLYTNVIGGASKIIKYYTTKYNIKSIYTYCDFSYSNGNGYKNIGFSYIGKTKPNYFWTDRTNIISRYQSRHTTNLQKIVGDLYDPNSSERENMMKAGYRRYWGCGNLIFRYDIS